MADAIIAVSRRDQEEIRTRFDVDPARVLVVPNGVDTSVYRPVDGKTTLHELGIDASRPFVLFVGRISRQKGIQHLLRAAERLSPGIGLVLVAASPDSPELERELERTVDDLRGRRSGVKWIRQNLPRDKTVALYSEAAVFCCPSVYEPFGIINLEAMACETPVVGTAVGGIREAVVHDETGLLVAFEPRSRDDPEPSDPDRLAEKLAEAIEQLVQDPSRRTRMGQRGRQRVIEHYSWDQVAARVYEVYEGVLGEARRNG
jgi:glycosyltransferase involved in cell wall biosynthesis